MAGTTVVNAVQLGNSATATHNFVAQTNQDGSGKLSRGNVGATIQDIMTWDASGNVNFPSGILSVGGVGAERLVVSTAQATTSGAAIDFTGIPSWVKRITITLSGVSTSGASNMLIRLGSGSIQATGYTSGLSYMGSGVGTSFQTTGMVVSQSTAAQAWTGVFTIVQDATGHYVFSGSLTDGSTYQSVSCGSVSIGAAIDRLRLTTANGTDTFDAGSVNILYEG